MKKELMTIAAVTLFGCTSFIAAAHADSGFGKSFTGETPAALSSSPANDLVASDADAAAAALNAIAPAAGDETNATADGAGTEETIYEDEDSVESDDGQVMYDSTDIMIQEDTQNAAPAADPEHTAHDAQSAGDAADHNKQDGAHGTANSEDDGGDTE